MISSLSFLIKSLRYQGLVLPNSQQLKHLAMNLGKIPCPKFWTLSCRILWCTKDFLPSVSLFLGSLTSTYLILVVRYNNGFKRVSDMRISQLPKSPIFFTDLFSPKIFSSFLDPTKKVRSCTLDLSSSLIRVLTLFFKGSSTFSCFTLQINSSSLAKSFSFSNSRTCSF